MPRPALKTQSSLTHGPAIGESLVRWVWGNYSINDEGRGGGVSLTAEPLGEQRAVQALGLEEAAGGGPSWTWNQPGSRLRSHPVLSNTSRGSSSSTHQAPQL